MKIKVFALLAAVFLALFPSISARILQESSAQGVLILFDSRSLEQLARDAGEEPEVWADGLRSAGMGGLALWPETLESLQSRGVLAWNTRAGACADPGWQASCPESVRLWLREPGDGVLAAVWDAETADWLCAALEALGEPYRRAAGEGADWVLLERDEAAAALPLGFWPETEELARTLGLTVCPVLSLREENDSLTLARRLWQQWAGAGPVLCAGPTLPGFAGEEPETARALLADFLDSGGTLALVESSAQRGSLELEGKETALAAGEGHLLRCYYQWDYLSAQYDAEDPSSARAIGLELARAAGERGCRVLWLQPLTDAQSGRTVEERAVYEEMVAGLCEDLARYGLYSAAEAEPVPALGGWLGVLPRQVLSLLTACAAGILCAWLLAAGEGGWGPLLLAQLTALAGGLAAAFWLDATPFLLGEAVFRGVKLAQLVPLAAYLAFLALRWGQGRRSTLAAALDRPVTVRMLLRGGLFALAGAGVLGIGAYYLARTGNSGLASDWELRLRDALERLLGVRPRFKEFAVGLPCLALYLWGGLPRPLRALAGLGAMVGLVSVINTFLHRWTPLAVSLRRTAAGWLLGALLALAVLTAVRLLRKWWPGRGESRKCL